MQDFFTFLSHHSALSGSMLGIFILLLIIEALRANRGRFGLTADEAVQKINHDNAVVIDIREKAIFEQGHIINAQSYLPADLNGKNKKIIKYKTKPMILVCSNGMISQKIATQLFKEGYNIYFLRGGIQTWNAAQMPLVKE